MANRLLNDIAVIDFETDSIERRPKYPPRSVGVSLWLPGEPPEYIAWGRPTNNGVWVSTGRKKVKAKRISASPREYGERRMREAWKRYTLLFHNAKFDLDVAETHHKLKIPDWRDFEDTLFALFLDDPHSRTISLKPSAARYLGMKPEEQDAVHDWLVNHKVARKDDKKWGRFISKAPGDLVGAYAIGDVVRTGKLHELLQKKLRKDSPPPGMRSMMDSYNREKRLLPVLLENEREGMRVDMPLLEHDIKLYKRERERVADWLRKRLRKPGLNIDSDRELAEALDKAKVVSQWTITESGQKSVAKDNLKPEHFKDRRVARGLGYHARLGTALGTFMEPWFEMGSANNDYILTTWNQVRQSHDGGGNDGARTGRLSCSPNFMNLPKAWEDKDDGYEHPSHLRIAPLPLCRKYILPDKGQGFGHRDYNQQEVRITAHFESDKLCEMYNTPVEDLPSELVREGRLDVHTYIQNQIRVISQLDLKRPVVKIVVFRTIYGGGAGGLAAKLKIPVEQAKQITRALRDAIPGLRALEQALDQRAASQQPIRTWGGRLYYCEPPSFSKKFGRMMTYEYKLLNYLVQGSAADCTKEAVIAYNEVRKEGRFVVTVHDEINISAPKKALKRELLRLREAMESQKFDVPMLSDPKMGTRWGDLKTFKEK